MKPVSFCLYYQKNKTKQKTRKQGHVFHIDLNSLSSLLYFILHVQTQHQEVHSEFLGP